MLELNKIPKELSFTFEEIWEEMNEKQKEINLKYWHSLYAKDKLLEPLKEQISILKKEKDYWKKRFEELQSKLEDPLDEIMAGIKLFAKDELFFFLPFD